MKKATIYFCLFLLTYKSFSQIEKEKFAYKNTLKVSVTQFFASEYRITYERYFFNHNFSIAISPAYVLNKKPSIFLNNNIFSELQGGGANLQLKKHLYNKYGAIYIGKGENNTIDFYFSGYAQYFYLKYVNENETYLNSDLYILGEPDIDIINAYEGGILLGFELSIYKNFIMEFYGGMGYKKAVIVSQPTNTPSINTLYWSRGFTGLVPRFGINFGFSL